ncbi:DNA-binding domain-containing protein [Novosphingobium sp.]|uniref:HvfC/BufC N-terminal domain-containing protein n=1 Tax=Novosphingobium sp. TaxID=1874826 RepID=UPI0025E55398|nr:DNA-binding domain-containing protein [Novosphingobium sp.]
MSELAAFQRGFVAALDQPMPAFAPMRVYLNTVMLGAVEALVANFPVTAMIVGARTFETNALAYARHFPPEVPVLALYGQGFAAWLEGQPLARELEYIADVARCEELHAQALHAAEAHVLQPQDLSPLDPERLLTLKLHLHPAARFGWFKTPAMALWLAHQDPIADEIAPQWIASGGLMTRPGNAVVGTILDPPSHRLLAGVRLGETMGGAAKATNSLFPDAAVGEIFAALISCGAFVAKSF